MRVGWEEVTWYSKLVIFFVFLGTFAFAHWLVTQWQSVTDDYNAYMSSVVSEIPQHLIATGSHVGCIDSPKYFVVTRDLAGSVGSSILVRYKTSDTQQFPCAYAAGKDDLELNLPDAGYFYGLTHNFLILDFGTAPPPRRLEIYDLNSRKNVFSDQYSPSTTISDYAVTYWSPATTTPTIANCPDLNTWKSEGLGAEIEAHISLDLLTLVKTTLGEYRCQPVQ